MSKASIDFALFVCTTIFVVLLLNLIMQSFTSSDTLQFPVRYQGTPETPQNLDY